MKRAYTYDNLMYHGRLGNQLWQIAWMYGSAKRNNGTLHIRPDWEYRHIFRIPEEYYEPVPPRTKKIDGHDNYFQELHHWNEFQEEVRQLFKVSDEAFDIFLDRTNEWPAFDHPLHSCSVHFRRGDYLKYPRHYPIPTESYYKEAMERVVTNDPDVKFHIFSDNIDWVKKNVSFLDSYNVVYEEGIDSRPVEVADRKGPPEDWIDLVKQSMCAQHIIANSSFSWWGAFRSTLNGSTFYPSIWYGPKLKHIDWRQAIPGDWIEIAC